MHSYNLETNANCNVFQIISKYSAQHFDIRAKQYRNPNQYVDSLRVLDSPVMGFDSRWTAATSNLKYHLINQ